MLGNENTLNNTVETPENSFSKDPLWQKVESLEKEIKSLRKQNQLNSGIIGLGVIGLIGYIIATNWSAIAPAIATAVTATAAALPVIGIVIGAIIGAAVLVGASYAAWRYIAEIKAGFKYAAEQTVEGAKHTAGKIKAGAVYAKDSVKKGYENSVDSLKRGAKNAADRLGSSLKEFAHSGEHPMESESVQKLLQQKGIKEVVNDTIEIAKADNSSVLPAIKSAMKSMIESSMRLGTLGSADKDNLEKQMKIVDRLDKILTNSTLDTEEFNLVTTIFSKYQNKVKGILDDYKQYPENYPKEPTLSQKMSSSFSLSSSFSSLRRKDSTQSGRSKVKVSLQKPFSSDLGVCDKNDKFYTPPSSGESTPTSGLSELVDHKALTKKLEELKESSSASRSNSSNSGRGLSGSSTPTKGQETSLEEEFNEELAKKFQELSKSSSGSSTPPKLFKPPVPPKPLAVNLAEANERKKQQTLSTSCSDSPDTGRGSSGSSTPTKGQETSLEALQNELKQRFAKLSAPLNQPNAEPVNPGVVHNK